MQLLHQLLIMIFDVNQSDPLPIYRQIERQVVDGVLQGELEPGEKLPSHRDLAKRLVVAPLTVKKAYDTLEANGFIVTRRGLGTFVSESIPHASAPERRRRLSEQAKRLVLDALAAAMSWSELRELLEETERDLGTKLERARRKKVHERH